MTVLYLTLNSARGQQDYILLCTLLHERNKIFILESRSAI